MKNQSCLSIFSSVLFVLAFVGSANADIGDGRLLTCQNEEYDFFISQTAIPTLQQGTLVSKADSSLVLNFRCRRREQPNPPCCDQEYTFWYCETDQNERDAYRIEVQTGGFAGLTHAQLSTVTGNSVTPITKMYCQTPRD